LPLQEETMPEREQALDCLLIWHGFQIGSYEAPLFMISLINLT
jgi:hypothetical protein